jgi:hypothetical protein
VNLVGENFVILSPPKHPNHCVPNQKQNLVDNLSSINRTKEAFEDSDPNITRNNLDTQKEGDSPFRQSPHLKHNLAFSKEPHPSIPNSSLLESKTQRVCQEKIITFEGVQLPQTFNNAPELFEKTPKRGGIIC